MINTANEKMQNDFEAWLCKHIKQYSKQNRQMERLGNNNNNNNTDVSDYNK